MRVLHRFWIRIKHSVHLFIKFINSISVKQWIAFIGIAVPLFALSLQMLQFNNEIDNQRYNIEMQNLEDDKQEVTFKLSLAHELARNMLRTSVAIAQYEKDGTIDPVPIYISDMYKAGITSGNVFLLPDKSLSAIFEFYETLPSYQSLVDNTARDIQAVATKSATCVEDASDCDLYREHINRLKKIQSDSLIKTIRSHEELLKRSITYMREEQ